jgi:hypothetical protein
VTVSWVCKLRAGGFSRGCGRLVFVWPRPVTVVFLSISRRRSRDLLIPILEQERSELAISRSSHRKSSTNSVGVRARIWSLICSTFIVLSCRVEGFADSNSHSTVAVDLKNTVELRATPPSHFGDGQLNLTPLQHLQPEEPVFHHGHKGLAWRAAVPWTLDTG